MLFLKIRQARMRQSVFLSIFLAHCAIVLTAPAADEIRILPGLAVQPRFKHYSGYLKAGGDRHLHYWFVESSQIPSSKAPLVLWLNGGPGCSSMEGMLRENGPFRVNDQATIDMNPWAWNSFANVIYLEAPAGVGYSYADHGNTDTYDDQVAQDNLLALKSFLKKFPEFSGRDFFITGESYAGVYIPTLAVLVVQDKTINLKAIAIGNGLSSYELNSNSLLYYMYYHGIIGDDAWNKMYSTCCDKCSGSYCDFLNSTSKACEKLVTDALAANDGLDIYNMFAPCHGGVSLLKYGHKKYPTFRSGRDEVAYFDQQSFLHRFRQESKRHPSSRLMALNNLNRGFFNAGFMRSSGDDPPCTNATAITTYLNEPLVRYALHINSSLGKFQVCSNLEYGRNYTDMTAVYKKLLPSGIRVLLYNGDADMACNYLGDQWFLDNLGLRVRIPRRAWYYEDGVEGRQIGGYAKQWDKVTFITVRGAGHMVPEDKPAQAFTLFHNFIMGLDF